MFNFKWSTICPIKHKPVHDCPFPTYPVLHVHEKLPALLVQVALVSQLWVLVEHSSMSKGFNECLILNDQLYVQ